MIRKQTSDNSNKMNQPRKRMLMEIMVMSLVVICSGYIGYNIESYIDLCQGAGTGASRHVMASNDVADASPVVAGAPYPRITSDNVHVMQTKTCIDGDYVWATFTDSNSMWPTFAYGHYVLQVVPVSETEIRVGDIVSYVDPVDTNTTIIHRVMNTKTDKEGWYAITKGDNNHRIDPIKVRFADIKRVVVAIIY